MLGSTSIPARPDTLVYREPFSWLTSVGTNRNTVIRLGWSRIGPAVLILHAAGVGLTDRPAVISGRYNKYHSLQLQNYYAHFPPLQHAHIHVKHNYAELVMGMIMGFEALYAGRGRRNPVWSGKEAHWSLRGLIVKSAEHHGADYKFRFPLIHILTKWSIQNVAFVACAEFEANWWPVVVLQERDFCIAFELRVKSQQWISTDIPLPGYEL